MGEEGKKGREGRTLQTKRGRGIEKGGTLSVLPSIPTISSVCLSSQNPLKYALFLRDEFIFEIL